MSSRKQPGLYGTVLLATAMRNVATLRVILVGHFVQYDEMGLVVVSGVEEG
jgi:hypothetical protein